MRPRRLPARVESADFRTFTAPQVVFGADERDPGDMDFYDPCSIKYPWAKGTYFLFPPALCHSSPRRSGR